LPERGHPAVHQEVPLLLVRLDRGVLGVEPALALGLAMLCPVLVDVAAECFALHMDPPLRAVVYVGHGESPTPLRERPNVVCRKVRSGRPAPMRPSSPRSCARTPGSKHRRSAADRPATPG